MLLCYIGFCQSRTRPSCRQISLQLHFLALWGDRSSIMVPLVVNSRYTPSKQSYSKIRPCWDILFKHRYPRSPVIIIRHRSYVVVFLPSQWLQWLTLWSEFRASAFAAFLGQVPKHASCLSWMVSYGAIVFLFRSSEEGSQLDGNSLAES